MKGQGATEYLVIFAAVLLVALIVIALLGSFAGQQQQALVGQSKSYWSSQTPISITDASASGTNMVLFLKNQDSKKVTVVNISVEGTNITSGDLPLKISSGDEESVSGTIASADSCTPSGSVKEYEIVIFYTKKGSSTVFTETGTTPLRVVCG